MNHKPLNLVANCLYWLSEVVNIGTSVMLPRDGLIKMIYEQVDVLPPDFQLFAYGGKRPSEAMYSGVGSQHRSCQDNMRVLVVPPLSRKYIVAVVCCCLTAFQNFHNLRFLDPDGVLYVFSVNWLGTRH
jgi:hypothetical protein